MYLVMGIIENATIDVLGKEQTLKLELAEGMTGCLPIFDTLENAEKYANGLQIIKVKFSNE